MSSYDTIIDRILAASSKAENRHKRLEEIFEEEYPDFNDEEYKKDLIDAILAKTIYSNDTLAQSKLKEIEKKYL